MHWADTHTKCSPGTYMAMQPSLHMASERVPCISLDHIQLLKQMKYASVHVLRDMRATHNTSLLPAGHVPNRHSTFQTTMINPN